MLYFRKKRVDNLERWILNNGHSREHGEEFIELPEWDDVFPELCPTARHIGHPSHGWTTCMERVQKKSDCVVYGIGVGQVKSFFNLLLNHFSFAVYSMGSQNEGVD